MSFATIHLHDVAAPCGRTGEGDHFQDEDEQCLISDDWFYACGCRSLQHEYHDGTFSRSVIRHDGRILIDELIAEHAEH